MDQWRSIAVDSFPILTKEQTTMLALGGRAVNQPTQQQQHSLYIPHGYSRYLINDYYTNEIHTMEMTNLQGDLYIIVVTCIIMVSL